MNNPVDPISEADLLAYVEDQLPQVRRLEVETYLCHNPDSAMRIMMDLRIRDELRLALTVPNTHRINNIDAARRLEQGLFRDRITNRVRQLAAVLILVGVGWFAHAQLGPLGVGEVVASSMSPAYVTDAVIAHRTAVLRSLMDSQPESPKYDLTEIRSATAIVIPTLDNDWQVTDVQIFPSTSGPSVEMAIRAQALGSMSLFAVRPETFDVLPVRLAQQGDVAAAYWQIGANAYVLVGQASYSGEISKAATQLARTLY
jgi:anti-sigma factor RsiW